MKKQKISILLGWVLTIIAFEAFAESTADIKDCCCLSNSAKCKNNRPKIEAPTQEREYIMVQVMEREKPVEEIEVDFFQNDKKIIVNQKIKTNGGFFRVDRDIQLFIVSYGEMVPKHMIVSKLPPNTPFLQFRLQKGQKIGGIVVDMDENPLAGIPLFWVVRSNGTLPTVMDYVLTNEKGEWYSFVHPDLIYDFSIGVDQTQSHLWKVKRVDYSAEKLFSNSALTVLEKADLPRDTEKNNKKTDEK